ncbi:hypothetical protein G5V59_02140 [Nocardioides sp. W3-2-3]|uniref:hypothetical protein n=1 Tax=Nocardioides convexus TaxID=2712224 RepID=UPI0024182F92|nr:hypothetical protein [Nocardioides convexus]NGZ99587.1 hypothetical protein [Nocardioides convexus]
MTVNSFLATGGDNFREFANGTSKVDTGKADLQAMVDYMAAKAAQAPLPVDRTQHAVQVDFPAGAPASYAPGDHVTFSVGSWAMSTSADTKDATLQVKARRPGAGDLPGRQHHRHGRVRPLRQGVGRRRPADEPALRHGPA